MDTAIRSPPSSEGHDRAPRCKMLRADRRRGASEAPPSRSRTMPP